MLRITSGIVKNKKLNTPNIEGFRAVQEVAKLAIFAILGEKVADAECLDLFAGSGNLGLEALSRGASWCDFVDENYEARKTLFENIKKCGFEDKSEVHLMEAVKYVGNTSKKYDVIFVDPFYKDTSHKFLVKNLAEIIKSDGVIFFLHGNELDMTLLTQSTPLQILSQRRYGKSSLSVLSLLG